MILTMLKGKLHRATVTHADRDYMGSIAIDATLIQAAGFLNHERVEIYNVTNGARFATYVIPAPPASGIIGIRGAAAHRAGVGDSIIIVAYAQMDEALARVWQPHIVLLDAKNCRLDRDNIRVSEALSQ